MWENGVIDGYTWEAKIFDEGSQFGIDGGRISKLCIRDAKNHEVCVYDRGWDTVPVTDKALKILEKLLNKYNTNTINGEGVYEYQRL